RDALFFICCLLDLGSLGGARFDCFKGLRASLADRNGARLLSLRNLPDEIDVQQSIFACRARHNHVVGELEASLEGASRDALIEHVTLLILLGGLLGS